MSLDVMSYGGASYCRSVLWERDGLMRLVDLAREHGELAPLLRGVDEYGDTYFNSLQCKYLVGEVEALRPLVGDDPALVEAVECLLRMAEVVASEAHAVHQQLCFVGD